MESLRFTAIKNIGKDALSYEVKSSEKVTTIFNENVFTLKTARHYLTDDAYKSLIASVKGGKKSNHSKSNTSSN